MNRIDIALCSFRFSDFGVGGVHEKMFSSKKKSGNSGGVSGGRNFG